MWCGLYFVAYQTADIHGRPSTVEQHSFHLDSCFHFIYSVCIINMLIQLYFICCLQDNMTRNWAVLIGMMVIFRLLAYFLLFVRTRRIELAKPKPLPTCIPAEIPDVPSEIRTQQPGSNAEFTGNDNTV